MEGFHERAFTLKWSGHRLNLHDRTHIMGVLNVTPDSFSDGGLFFQRDKAIEQGFAMVRDGADIIDIGGESTRPYAKSVASEEELERVIPVIEGLAGELKIPISIDTCKAEVARQALKAGASIINDISALRFDPGMASVAAEAGVPLILMHMKGTPGDMQDKPHYDNLIPEISAFLRAAMDRAEKEGVRENMIIVDPGIGFGKTFDHNLDIIRNLHRLRLLGRPIMLGVSRKAFLGHILGNEPLDRDTGSMAAVTAGILNGAHIVRVHNTKMAVETAKVADAIGRAGIGR